MLEYLNPLDDDVSFVDLTIFSICEDYFRKQAMLEVQSLAKRGRMIIDDLILENKRLSLLRRLWVIPMMTGRTAIDPF